MDGIFGNLCQSQDVSAKRASVGGFLHYCGTTELKSFGWSFTVWCMDHKDTVYWQRAVGEKDCRPGN